MTNLVQLRDCHSCYDERSIIQKKKILSLAASDLSNASSQKFVGDLPVWHLGSVFSFHSVEPSQQDFDFLHFYIRIREPVYCKKVVQKT